jgi:DNA-binding CsgD family transcriptional regulator
MKEEIGRIKAKTAEQRFMNILEKDFKQAPRVAEAILSDAQACLEGRSEGLKPGQMRVILADRQAGHGQKIKQTAMVEVIWTVDAGSEDYKVLEEDGREAMRRHRIQRLLAEAVGQGGAASQEDLARVLSVSVRTIKRDCAYLEKKGIYLPTRGNLRGIGRGQTHKALIVGRWLAGESYDQIARQTHHSLSSVQRYIQAFLRVMQLHRQGLAVVEIALLLQIGQPLVKEYLAIYDQQETPFARQRLTRELQRLGQRGMAQKKRIL